MAILQGAFPAAQIIVTNLGCLRTDEFTGLRKNLPGHFTGRSKTTECTDRILEQASKPTLEMGNSRKKTATLPPMCGV
jgi:hypothetical protein